MKKQLFRIKLKGVHLRHNMTYYAVGKALGINQNTVRKYLSDNVEQSYLPADVARIIEFFGLDWRDPSVVEIVDIEDDEEEHKTLLAAPA